MLLSIELPLRPAERSNACSAGRPPRHPPERHLSEIDWALAKGLLDGIVGELSAAWGELGGPELTRGEVDLEGDAGVLTPAGEPTLVSRLTSTIARLSPRACRC